MYVANHKITYQYLGGGEACALHNIAKAVPSNPSISSNFSLVGMSGVVEPTGSLRGKCIIDVIELIF